MSELARLKRGFALLDWMVGGLFILSLVVFGGTFWLLGRIDAMLSCGMHLPPH